MGDRWLSWRLDGHYSSLGCKNGSLNIRFTRSCCFASSLTNWCNNQGQTLTSTSVGNFLALSIVLGCKLFCSSSTNLYSYDLCGNYVSATGLEVGCRSPMNTPQPAA